MTPEKCRTHAKNTEIIWRGQPGWSEDANMAIEWREAADEIERLRAALYEVTTNGEWTDGEHRGAWKISKEVYETARDALS